MDWFSGERVIHLRYIHVHITKEADHDFEGVQFLRTQERPEGES
jgi:hypothetical protein